MDAVIKTESKQTSGLIINGAGHKHTLFAKEAGIFGVCDQLVKIISFFLNVLENADTIGENRGASLSGFALQSGGENARGVVPATTISVEMKL